MNAEEVRNIAKKHALKCAAPFIQDIRSAIRLKASEGADGIVVSPEVFTKTTTTEHLMFGHTMWKSERVVSRILPDCTPESTMRGLAHTFEDGFLVSLDGAKLSISWEKEWRKLSF